MVEQRISARKAPAEPLDRKIIVLALVVLLGNIMSMIDTTVVNVALDTLGQDLNAALAEVQWVVTGYLLALALVMPITGWAVDRFGAKRCWTLSVLLFTVGSILAGLAWSIGSLIAFRVLQGIGGGMLLPVGQSILAQAAGPGRMGRVMSLMGVSMLIAPVVGPILGGVIVQGLSWHWIFYVNVPIGLIALVLAVRVIPSTEIRREKRLDVPGLAMVSIGVAGFVYGVSTAGSTGSFASPDAYGWMAGGAVLLGIFVVYSLRRGAAALIDVRLFANRHFAAGSATALLVGMGLFGSMLLLPLYYQVVLGEDVMAAGLLLVPQGLGAATAVLPAGRITDRFGARVVVLPGLVLAMLGTVVYTQVTAHSSYLVLSLALFVRGLGLGATMMPAVAAAYATLGRDAVPRATTTINIIRQLGASLGSALLAVVLISQISRTLPTDRGGHDFERLSDVPPDVRADVASRLADAFGYTFWVAFALTVITVLPMLFMPAGPVARPSAGDRAVTRT